MNAPTPWHRGPLGAFDLETTGTNVFEDRIVTATFIEIDTTTGVTREHEWLINPGVEIPEGATRVHGVTTEHAREHGRPPAEAIAEINARIKAAQDKGIPVVGFNVSYDFSLLHAESVRHGQRMPQLTRVVDPAVIDKEIDRYRRGSKKLTDVAAHYGVRLDNAHTSSADAMAAARVAWVMAERHPQLQIPLEELHAKQQRWKAGQAAGLQTYFRSTKGDQAITVAPQWPLQLPTDDPDALRSPYLEEPAATPKPAAVKVPAGRYALEGSDGITGFYLVEKPTDGKWIGHTFLKRQSGEDLIPVKGAERAAVLRTIAQAPKEASILFGRKRGVCGVCNRTLTDPESVAAGIGPICVGKF